jgi:hypothetical protein
MTWIVREYPGEHNPNGPVIDLGQHGSMGEAQIDVFGRAARWAGEDRPNRRRVTAPADDAGRVVTAILWDADQIAGVLNAEPAP